MMLNKYSLIVQLFHHMNNYCEKFAYVDSLHLRGDDKKSGVHIFCTIDVVLLLKILIISSKISNNVCFDYLYFLYIFIYFLFMLHFWG